MTNLTAAQRQIRSAEIDAAAPGGSSDAITRMYDDELDVLIVRNALPREPLEAAGERLDRDDADPGWARPNIKMPVEDIQILGTDTPATPTYQAPRGATLDAYLASADKHREEGQGVFDSSFDAADEITRLIGTFAGGRDVEIARAADGRSVRALHGPSPRQWQADRIASRFPLPDVVVRRVEGARRYADAD